MYALRQKASVNTRSTQGQFQDHKVEGACSTSNCPGSQPLHVYRQSQGAYNLWILSPSMPSPQRSRCLSRYTSDRCPPYRSLLPAKRLRGDRHPGRATCHGTSGRHDTHRFADRLAGHRPLSGRLHTHPLRSTGHARTGRIPPPSRL